MAEKNVSFRFSIDGSGILLFLALIYFVFFQPDDQRQAMYKRIDSIFNTELAKREGE